MRVGLSGWSLHQNCGRGVANPRPLDVFGLLALARQWQLDCVQIEEFADDPETLARIRGTAEDYGLILEMETWGLTPEFIRTRLEVAKALAMKVIRTFPGLNRYHAEQSLAKQLETAAANLGLIAQHAERIGIFVAIENHQDMITDRIRSQDISAGELANLLDQVDSPWVGACLDAGNCLAYLEDPVESAARLAPRVLTVHVKDYRIKRTFRGAEIAGCALGAGALDVEAITRLVAEGSPLGKDVCLHVEAPVERIQVPFLEPEYWAGYTEQDAMRLPKYVQLLAEKGEPPEADFRSPAEQGRPLDEILDHELAQVAASVEFMRSMVKEIG